MLLALDHGRNPLLILEIFLFVYKELCYILCNRLYKANLSAIHNNSLELIIEVSMLIRYSRLKFLNLWSIIAINTSAKVYNMIISWKTPTTIRAWRILTWWITYLIWFWWFVIPNFSIHMMVSCIWNSLWPMRDNIICMNDSVSIDLRVEIIEEFLISHSRRAKINKFNISS